MEEKKKILDIIRDRQTQLPTLPVVAGNVLRITSDDKTSVRDLSEFIRQDQAISNKLLKLANSAYYGLIKKVDNIPRALTVIGFSDVTSLAIGMSVFSSLKLKKTEKVLKMRNLWLHSIGCATAAQELTKITGSNNSDQIFLNGLLHDMGKVIFAIYFPEDYMSILLDAEKNNQPLHMVEEESFGIDHARMAGYLMEQWNFPDTIAMPSRFHHKPAKCPKEYMHEAMIIQLADFICHKTKIGTSGTPILEDIKATAGNLGLTAGDLKKVALELKKQRPKIEEFLKAIS